MIPLLQISCMQIVWKTSEVVACYVFRSSSLTSSPLTTINIVATLLPFSLLSPLIFPKEAKTRCPCYLTAILGQATSTALRNATGPSSSS